MNEPRTGEVTLPFDPADRVNAGVTFIGRIRSPWSRGDCPKNLVQAREAEKPGFIELDPAYLRGLQGLVAGQAIVLLYWMDRGSRDLIVQAPRHTNNPKGTFALRSPRRPNPIAMAVVTLTGVDHDTGILNIDAIDCFDDTPLLDIKPWFDTVDIPPGR